MRVARDAIWCYDDVQVFAATEGHVWACVHVHGPSYHQSPGRNSRSVRPPEAMSVGHAASGPHTELSSLLPPEAMVISWSHGDILVPRCGEPYLVHGPTAPAGCARGMCYGQKQC